MAQLSQFKILFALKFNLNGGHFQRDISKFGYFKNLQIIFKIFFFQKLSICGRKLINKIVKKFAPRHEK